MLKHTIKRVPWLTGLFRHVNNETVVRLRDKKAYARWKFMKSLRNLSSLIVTEKMVGGEITENGEFYIRTHDDIYLYYNYSDNRFTLGDGQSLDFRSAYREIFFEKFMGLHSDTLKTYIDVGANNGYCYSLKIAKRIPSSRVYAFEPDNNIIPHLMRNIEFNGLKNITVVQQALSNVVGTAKLTCGFGASGYLVTGDSSLADTVSVKCNTLDNFVKQNGIEQVDAIKVDIEGGELNFLRGAAESIKIFKPVILLELVEKLLQRNDSSVGDVVCFLKTLGYRCYRIMSTSDALCVPDYKLTSLTQADHSHLAELK